MGDKNDIPGIMEVILSLQKDKSSKKVLIAYKKLPLETIVFNHHFRKLLGKVLHSTVILINWYTYIIQNMTHTAYLKSDGE